MTALTKDTDTPQRQGQYYEHPVAAAAVCYAGGIAVLDASGNAEPGTLATGMSVAGKVTNVDADGVWVEIN